MLFQFEGVTKTYGAVTALDNLSLAVPTGITASGVGARLVPGVTVGGRCFAGFGGGDMGGTEHVAVRS